MAMKIRVKLEEDVVFIRGEIPTQGGVPLATDWVAVTDKAMETAVNEVLQEGRKRYEDMRAGGTP